MAELLLELLSEEIPARMQARAAEDLHRLVTEKLKAAGLEFDHAAAFATPRRLALVATGLPHKTADVAEEKKGPRVGSPDQAIQGFLKGAGLTSLDQCEKRAVGKAEFWFAVAKRKGVEAAAVLPALLTEAITALPWPKSMRFADATLRWVRPLHGVLAIFAGKTLPGAVARGGGLKPLEFEDGTRGHRFLGPQPFKVKDFRDYRHRLKAAHVVLDREERKAIIDTELRRLAASHGLTLKEDKGLLEEVCGLVEWPAVLVGKVDPQFIALPPEVLSTSMRAHQKYFSLAAAGGRVTHFGVVANMPNDPTRDRTIVAGNERVLRARLSDAQFFWEQDKRVKLAERLPALKELVFHAKLGAVHDKVERLKALAPAIAKSIPHCAAAEAKQAAELCKADLVTGMVGEFPELQGVMGRYYARAENLPEAVSDAIAEHYAPQGPNDRCPTAPVSVALALADKIDTLAGFFAIDEKPTGSKDPFALRRAALGIIRLIVENKLRLHLRDAFGDALGGLKRVSKVAPVKPDAALAELLDFIADRLKVALREKGVRHDQIAAVFALGGQDDIVALLRRVDALDSLLKSDDGDHLLTAYRRAANILRIEEKKDGRSFKGAHDAKRLREDAEKALVAAMEGASVQSGEAIKREDYPAAMAALARLRAPVDRFFDKVTVNADDAALRENRLKLLSEIQGTMDRIADFGRIEG